MIAFGVFYIGWICNFVVNVFWLGCDLPKGASQRPWSKQLRVKFKLNSIEWMDTMFLSSSVPYGSWSWILIYFGPCSSISFMFIPHFRDSHWLIQMKNNPSNRMKNPWNWKILNRPCPRGMTWFVPIAGLQTQFSKDAGIWSLCSKMSTRGRMCLVLVGFVPVVLQLLVKQDAKQCLLISF